MFPRLAFVAACIAALPAGPLASEPKANFTGTWKLDEKAAPPSGAHLPVSDFRDIH